MPIIGISWLTAAAIAAVGTAIYTSVESQQRGKSAKKAASKQRAAISQRELQAGEHWEALNREQMELQSQMSQIKLLSDVITSKRQSAPRILQLPAAKTYTPAERVNAAIDDFLKRR